MKEPHPLLVALIYAKEYRNAATCTTRIIRIPVPLEAKSVLPSCIETLAGTVAAADDVEAAADEAAAELDEFAATLMANKQRTNVKKDFIVVSWFCVV